MTKAKIKRIKAAEKLVGKKISTNEFGHAGREVEKLLEELGIKINRGSGPDILDWGVEVKTRKTSATSAQSVTTMSVDDIKNTAYYDSPVYKKFQQQLRIKTNDDDVITEVDIYDFDQPHIQEKVEAAYEHAREQLIKNPNLEYTPYEGYYGYFEKKTNSSSYDFRISDRDMKTFERMAKSTFTNHFKEV